MKKQIPPATLERYKLLIKDAKNIMNCQELTGIHNMTINKIIKTGFASQQHIAKLNDYCDEVETVNA